jgi:hypothetical protein
MHSAPLDDHRRAETHDHRLDSSAIGWLGLRGPIPLSAWRPDGLISLPHARCLLLRVSECLLQPTLSTSEATDLRRTPATIGLLVPGAEACLLSRRQTDDPVQPNPEHQPGPSNGEPEFCGGSPRRPGSGLAPRRVRRWVAKTFGSAATIRLAARRSHVRILSRSLSRTVA